MSDYSIQPLTTHTWDPVANLVERHNGVLGGCWCTWFHPRCADRERSYEGSRALKQRLVEDGQARAALVMVGEEAIAWAEFGKPDELPNIYHRKQYLAEADVIPDYRITCIFIDKRHRRHGYAKDPAPGLAYISVTPMDKQQAMVSVRVHFFWRSGCPTRAPRLAGMERLAHRTVPPAESTLASMG